VSISLKYSLGLVDVVADFIYEKLQFTQVFGSSLERPRYHCTVHAKYLIAGTKFIITTSESLEKVAWSAQTEDYLQIQ
jgi:hypothetical protein